MLELEGRVGRAGPIPAAPAGGRGGSSGEGGGVVHGQWYRQYKMKYWSLAPILLRPNRYTNSYLQAYGGVTCGDLEKIRTSRSKNMRVANISPQVRRKCVSYFKLRRNTGVASRPHPARPPHVGSGLQPLSNLEVGHYLLFPIPLKCEHWTLVLARLAPIEVGYVCYAGYVDCRDLSPG